MSDPILASIVTGTVALLLAALGAVQQRWTTKRLIDAEDRRLKVRIGSETLVAREEARRSDLRRLLAEVIRRAEPSEPDLKGLASVIMEAQLLLDVRRPAEKALNGQLNRVGHLSLQGERSDMRDLLEAHAELLEKSRKVLGLSRIDGMDQFDPRPE